MQSTLHTVASRPNTKYNTIYKNWLEGGGAYPFRDEETLVGRSGYVVNIVRGGKGMLGVGW